MERLATCKTYNKQNAFPAVIAVIMKIIFFACIIIEVKFHSCFKMKKHFSMGFIAETYFCRLNNMIHE